MLGHEYKNTILYASTYPNPKKLLGVLARLGIIEDTSPFVSMKQISLSDPTFQELQAATHRMAPEGTEFTIHPGIVTEVGFFTPPATT